MHPSVISSVKCLNLLLLVVNYIFLEEFFLSLCKIYLLLGLMVCIIFPEKKNSIVFAPLLLFAIMLLFGSVTYHRVP